MESLEKVVRVEMNGKSDVLIYRRGLVARKETSE